MQLTKSTVSQILELIRTAYDNVYIGKSESDMYNLVELWYDCLKEYPQEVVLQATKNAIKHSEFAPRIATVVAEIKKLIDSVSKTDMELWAELNGILYSVYDTSQYLRYPQHYESARIKIQKIYGGLSEDLKLYIVNVASLIELAKMSERDRESFRFEKSRFLKMMPELKSRSKDKKAAETFLRITGSKDLIQLLGGGNVN